MSATKEIIRLLNSLDRRLARIEVAVCQSATRSIDPNGAYSRQEAARVLGASVWLIDRARKDGCLAETERLGQRDVRITGESLARFHQERKAWVKVNRI